MHGARLSLTVGLAATALNVVVAVQGRARSCVLCVRVLRVLRARFDSSFRME